jgi:hypothetical protein
MRKLEHLMMKAVHDAADWKLSNTEVRRERSSYATHTVHILSVHLHGNHIADVTVYPATGLAVATANRATFIEWPSRTTVSRLRALGINASVKYRVPHIDGHAVVPPQPE